jgi:hypothetical protein
MRDLFDDTEPREDVAKRRQDDFDQQQREASGVDVGQIARFYPGQAAHGVAAQEKKANEQAYRDLLEVYLRDPKYAALCIELGEKLSAHEIDADLAIDAYEVEIAQMNALIAEMENKAARDPKGQLVFKYADGRVVTANDDTIPIEIAEGIIWPDRAPTAEEYFAVKDNLAAFQTQLDEWHSYRNDTLGSVRDRYDDRDNPMSKDDLRGALEDIERAAPDAVMLARDEVRAAAPTPAQVSVGMIPTALK